MLVLFCVEFLLKLHKFLYKPFECKCNRLLIFYGKHIYAVCIFK